jgi:hypothetical protein
VSSPPGSRWAFIDHGETVETTPEAQALEG